MRSADPAEWLVPIDRVAILESYILKHAPKLAGRMLTSDEIASRPIHSSCVGTIIHCLGNLAQTWAPRDIPWLAVIDTDQFNAMIARVQDETYVVVSSSLYLAVGMATHAVLVDPGFVEFLETGVIPVDDVETLDRSRRDAISSLFERATQSECPSPELQTALMTLACYFLAAHEMGHLAQGHLDRLGTPEFVIEADEDDAADRSESRCLEWNADVFAGIATTFLTGSEQWRPIFYDPRYSLRCFVAATYLLFSLMDLGNDDLRDPALRTHPDPMVRAGIMTMAISTALAFGRSIPEEEIQEIRQETVRALEIAIGRIGGGMLDEDRYGRVVAAGSATLDEISEIWPELREKLNMERTKSYMWAPYIP